MRERRSWPKTVEAIWLLLRVLGLLTTVRLLLPFVKLDTLLRRLTPSRVPSAVDPRAIETVVRYTDALLWCMPFTRQGPCLPRSLMLYYFATRCGVPVHFHCRVRRLGGALQGHAWLSLHGRAFLEKGDPRSSYAVTFSFPAPERAAVAAELPVVRMPHKSSAHWF